MTPDVAQTGFTQQEQLENAVAAYLRSLSTYVRKKRLTPFDDWSEVDLSDFSWFTYQRNDPFSASLARNVYQILNLALLAILGFAGTYVAILRYDVR